MTDERSERLRRRRKRSIEGPDPPSENGSSRAASTDGEQADPPEVETSTSIKEEQIGTYMYLPESQTKKLKRLYNVLKAEYEFEYDEEFEKNRHFYPLVVRYGLESLDGLDASEIRSRLEEMR